MRTLTFTVAKLQSVCNPHPQVRAELARGFTAAIRTLISVDTGYCVKCNGLLGLTENTMRSLKKGLSIWRTTVG